MKKNTGLKAIWDKFMNSWNQSADAMLDSIANSRTNTAETETPKFDQ